MLGFNFSDLSISGHSYYVCSTGTDFKAHSYRSRKEAEEAMWAYCTEHEIIIECTEYDKHERKYSNHKGVRFYINRI